MPKDNQTDNNQPTQTNDPVDNIIKETMGVDDAPETDTEETPEAPEVEGAEGGEAPEGSDPGGAKSGKSGDGDAKPGQNRTPGDRVTKDGPVKAGAERRVYEKLEREVMRSRHRAEAAERELKIFREANQLVSQYGLNASEVTDSIKIAAAWKKDPVEVIGFLLTEAKAAGYDLTKVTGAGSGVDTKAITEIIDRKLAPLNNHFDLQRETREAVIAAEDEYYDLHDRYPEILAANEDVIADMLDADESDGLTADSAILKLENYCLKRGLDISKPLKPQLENSARKNPNQNTKQRSTIPSGRPSLPQQQQPLERKYAEVGDSNKDIIKQVLRETNWQPKA